MINFIPEAYKDFPIYRYSFLHASHAHCNRNKGREIREISFLVTELVIKFILPLPDFLQIAESSRSFYCNFCRNIRTCEIGNIRIHLARGAMKFKGRRFALFPSEI